MPRDRMIASRGTAERGTPMPSHRRMHGSYTGWKPSSASTVTIL